MIFFNFRYVTIIYTFLALLCSCTTQYRKNMHKNSYALASMPQYNIRDVSKEIEKMEERFLKDINFPKNTFFGAVTLIKLNKIDRIFSLAQDINREKPSIPFEILVMILEFSQKPDTYDIKTYKLLDYLDKNFKDQYRDNNRENSLKNQKCDIIEYYNYIDITENKENQHKTDYNKQLFSKENTPIFQNICYKGKFENFKFTIKRDDEKYFYAITTIKYLNAFIDIPWYITRDYWQFYCSSSINLVYCKSDIEIKNKFNIMMGQVPSYPYTPAYKYSFYISNFGILKWTDLPISINAYCNAWDTYRLNLNLNNIIGAEILLRSIQNYTRYMPISVMAIASKLAMLLACCYAGDKINKYFTKKVVSKIPYVGGILYDFNKNKSIRLVVWLYLAVQILLPTYYIPFTIHKIPGKIFATYYTRLATKKHINAYLDKTFYLDGWLEKFWHC